MLGKKAPKRARNESDAIKMENEKLVVQVENFSRDIRSLEAAFEESKTKISELDIDLKKTRKLSTSRLVKLRRLNKASRESEDSYRELKSLLDATEQKLAALEKIEEDVHRAKVEKLEAEKADSENRWELGLRSTELASLRLYGNLAALLSR